MNEVNNLGERRSQGPDGVGCVGSLLIFGLMLFIMGAIITGQDAQGGAPQATVMLPADTATAEPALVLPSPTLHLTDTPVPSSPTPTSAPTDTAVPTDTPTLPPMATATAGLPPLLEDTATPTLTPTPVLLPTPNGIYSYTLRVPILMYHYVSTPPEDADIYRVDLSVEPHMFREQIAFLAANGYTTIDLYDLSLAITGQAELPLKPVIITVDDGYLDNYLNAFPILQEFGAKATFFIITEFVDRGYDAYMNWPMIEEMAAAGMRMEPHTKTHVDLRGQSQAALIWQILGSQETLAAHIGYTPRYFAYPGGRYDEDTIQILHELDFWGAVTTMGGRWHGFEGRYEWTRMRVRHSTTLAEFANLVDPANTVRGRAPAE